LLRKNKRERERERERERRKGNQRFRTSCSFGALEFSFFFSQKKKTSAKPKVTLLGSLTYGL
jgi:hypothetical protein